MKLYDKKETAAMLNCSVSKIEKMMKAGEITYEKIGALVRFRPSDIAPFFAVTTPSPGSVPTRIEIGPTTEKIEVYGAVRGRR